MIAALFVLADGPYAVPGIDVWDERRDARLYSGPHRVIAHPPCERWGRYWSGGPSAKVRRVLGDDGGCFASALASVRKYGGVLEHPEASHAFSAHDLPRPPRAGGWVEAPDGWVCCVEQGHYGHPARKASWLYASGIAPMELIWGPSLKTWRPDACFHNKEERKRAVRTGICQRLSKRQRMITPVSFARLLIDMVAR